MIPSKRASFECSGGFRKRKQQRYEKVIIREASDNPGVVKYPFPPEDRRRYFLPPEGKTAVSDELHSFDPGFSPANEIFAEADYTPEIFDPLRAGLQRNDNAQADSGMGILKAVESRSITCDTCNENFSRTSALQRHKKTKHGDPVTMKMFDCGICGRLFSRKDTLQRHVASHDKSGYVMCLGCQGSFRPDFLQEHIRARKNAQCLEAYSLQMIPEAPFMQPPDMVFGSSESASDSASSDKSSTVSTSASTESDSTTFRLSTTTATDITQEDGSEDKRSPTTCSEGMIETPTSTASQISCASSISGYVPSNPFVPSLDYEPTKTSNPGQCQAKLSSQKAKIFKALSGLQKAELKIHLDQFETLSTRSLHDQAAESSIRERVRTFNISKASLPAFRPSKHTVWKCKLCGEMIPELHDIKVHALDHIYHPLQFAVSCEECEIGFVFKKDLRLHQRFECLDGTTATGNFISECQALAGDYGLYGDKRQSFIADLRVWERFQHYDNLIHAEEFIDYWIDKPRPKFDMSSRIDERRRKFGFSSVPPRAIHRSICGQRSTSVATASETRFDLDASMSKLSIHYNDPKTIDPFAFRHERPQRCLTVIINRNCAPKTSEGTRRVAMDLERFSHSYWE